MKAATPILKWPGGKRLLVARLLPAFPSRYRRYYEPFVGGASVLLGLRPEAATIGDRNDWLLDTYEAVRSDPMRVAAILDGMVATKEEFYRMRGVDPAGLDLYGRAAHLIYLNKTCFRGLFRVNRRGRFNVPFGQDDRRFYDADNLLAVSEALRNATIRRGDFASCLHDAGREDFVYLDPPYHPLGGYADFDRYTAERFREADHVRLAELCRSLDAKGVRWAASNSDTPFVRDLFRGYRFETVDGRRDVATNPRNRSVAELLIFDYADADAACTFGESA